MCVAGCKRNGIQSFLSSCKMKLNLVVFFTFSSARMDFFCTRKKKFIPFALQKKAPCTYTECRRTVQLKFSSVKNISVFSCLIANGILLRWIRLQCTLWVFVCVCGWCILLFSPHRAFKHDLILILLDFVAHSSLSDKHRISALIYYVIHLWLSPTLQWKFQHK